MESLTFCRLKIQFHTIGFDQFHKQIDQFQFHRQTDQFQN